MKGLRFIYLALFIIVGLQANGKNILTDTLWQKGNDFYAMGNFESAINNYLTIEKEGFISSELYYNLGNSYYRLGNIGRSVLYYERALKLDPSNKDVKANLTMANTRCIDKIDAVPEFVLVTLVKKIRDSFSSNTWAVVALIFFIIALLGYIFFKQTTSIKGKKLVFITNIVVIFIAIVSFLFSYSLYSRASSNDTAVIISGIGNVKSAPNSTGNSIFVLHSGTKVNVLESIGEWSRIEIRDGRQGWINNSDIEII